MTAARSYKKPMAVWAARRELADCAGGQFDPEIVRAFLSISLPKLLWRTGPGTHSSCSSRSSHGCRRSGSAPSPR